MKKFMLLVSSLLLTASLSGCAIWDDCEFCESGYDDDSWIDGSWSVSGSGSWMIEGSIDGSCSSCGSCSSGGCGSGYDDGSIGDSGDVFVGVGIGGACRRSMECADGLVCNFGQCVDPNDLDFEPIPGDPIPQPECYSNQDCGGDDICTNGRCIPCQTDKCDTSKEVECVFSTQCESGLCSDGVCLKPGACVIDSNCQSGQICFDHACIARPECMSDAECGQGKICNPSGSCEDDVECRVDSDCGSGKICVSNMCAECRLNCECPNAGDVCLNGVCVAG